MALTLAQAQNFSQDKLVNAIYSDFRKSQLMENMVFDDCVSMSGSGTLNYVYNRVKTLGTAEFREIGVGEYTPKEADTTRITVALKAFGGSYQIDRVLQRDVKGISDQMSFQIEQKSVATKALFADTFVNGDEGANAQSFDGIDKAVAGSSTEKIPSAPIDLSTIENIKANGNSFMYLLDMMLADMDSKPTFLLMNPALYAIMNTIARNSGYFSTSDVDAFGAPVTKYQGVPFFALGDKPGTSTPIVPIDSTAGTTSIFAVRVGLDGVHAVTPSGSPVITSYLPDFTSPGAIKKGELEMVAAVAVKATRAAAVLRKIKVR